MKKFSLNAMKFRKSLQYIIVFLIEKKKLFEKAPDLIIIDSYKIYIDICMYTHTYRHKFKRTGVYLSVCMHVCIVYVYAVSVCVIYIQLCDTSIYIQMDM